MSKPTPAYLNSMILFLQHDVTEHLARRYIVMNRVRETYRDAIERHATVVLGLLMQYDEEHIVGLSYGPTGCLLMCDAILGGQYVETPEENRLVRIHARWNYADDSIALSYVRHGQSVALEPMQRDNVFCTSVDALHRHAVERLSNAVSHAIVQAERECVAHGNLPVMFTRVIDRRVVHSLYTNIPTITVVEPTPLQRVSHTFTHLDVFNVLKTVDPSIAIEERDTDKSGFWYKVNSARTYGKLVRAFSERLLETKEM